MAGTSSSSGLTFPTSSGTSSTVSTPLVTSTTAPTSAVSSTSAARTSTSSTQASPALVVAASSSGTTSTTTAALSAAPKLPTDITGKTVEQDHSGKFRKHGNDVAERILQERDIVLTLERVVTKVFDTRGTLEQKLELIVQLMADMGFSFSSTSSSSSPFFFNPFSASSALSFASASQFGASTLFESSFSSKSGSSPSGGAPCSPTRWEVSAPCSRRVTPLTHNIFEDNFFTTCSFFWGTKNLSCLLSVDDQGDNVICGVIATRAILFADLQINGGGQHMGNISHLLDEVPQISLASRGRSDAPLCPQDIMQFVKERGMEVCEAVDGKVFIEGYTFLQPRNKKDEAMINKITGHLSQQPLAAIIRAPPSFMFWEPGVGAESIYCGASKKERKEFKHLPVHAITLLGYGTESDIDYFLFQNSNGLNWGVDGFGKIKRQCILQAFFPIGTYFGEKKKRLKGRKKKKLENTLRKKKKLD